MTDDDERPKKPRATHDIGQPLDLLSIGEIDERIALLRDEIARLETAKEKKHAATAAAAMFFKN